MSGRTGSLPDVRSPNLVTTLAREFRGSYAFIERNLFLVKRYWGWEFAFLVYAVAGALVHHVHRCGATGPDACCCR